MLGPDKFVKVALRQMSGKKPMASPGFRLALNWADFVFVYASHALIHSLRHPPHGLLPSRTRLACGRGLDGLCGLWGAGDRREQGGGESLVWQGPAAGDRDMAGSCRGGQRYVRVHGGQQGYGRVRGGQGYGRVRGGQGYGRVCGGQGYGSRINLCRC